jgi:DNA-binding NarL/FixJ family response regulator
MRVVAALWCCGDAGAYGQLMVNTPECLLGREGEKRQVAQLLGGARNGRGGALLICGAPGIGKTSLLEVTTAALPQTTVLRADGFEVESQIPFAAVQRLIIPLRSCIGDLPARYRLALNIASGTAAGPPPDRYLVGLGLLDLISAAGSRMPVVCAVDDAHLLDSESLDVLAFVARRLGAESAALVFAARDAENIRVQMAGIPVLPLVGLKTDSAMQLLSQSLSEDLDPAVAVQIAAATGGNPLALTDLASELSVRQLTECSFGEEPFPVGRHLELFYLRQVRQLSEGLQIWLLSVAAESTGNIDLISAAAKELGLPESLWSDAEASGLVAIGSTVRFRHPLVRSAAYNAAHGKDRRRVHHALSASADAMGLPERSAWHAAKATLGTDEAVARRLEEVADVAGRRGGFASRANVLAQASALSPGNERHRRLVAAAEAALAAGKATLAKSLLDDVDDDALDAISRGRMLSLIAQLALFTADPAVVRGCAELLRAAEMFRGRDDLLEQDTLIRAWECYLPAEDLAEEVEAQELGDRMRSGAARRDGVASTVLEGLSALVLRPYKEAVPLMRRAVETLSNLGSDEFLKYGSSSAALTTALWDNESRYRCLRRTADAARDSGSLQMLESALWVLSLAETLGGTPRRAAQYIEQVRELRRAIGFDAEHVINVSLLAWQGVPRDQVVAMADGAATMGFGGVRSAAMRVVAIVDLAHADYERAYLTLEPLVQQRFFHIASLSDADFVEAAARTDRVAETEPLVSGLEQRAVLNESRWARGVAERSRALVSADVDAEDHYRAAVTALAGNLAEVDLARTHLLYGEWLRRMRRRRDAREQLHLAAELFRRAGAEVFLPRLNNELAATGGETLTAHKDDYGLTPQEANVATLAAGGNTNAEIGATMFISANTVDYHLHKVFQKLGISSRRQLADKLDKTTH